MAKLAIAVGGALGGAFLGPAPGTSALVGAQAGFALGSIAGGLIFRPKAPTAPLQDLQVSVSAPGTPIPFGYGTCRFGGVVIWTPGITFTTNTQKYGGLLGIGGQNETTFTYYADFAVAFGEGPAVINRIWGDSKIIFSALPGDQSDFPVADYPPWSPTQLYNPDNLVSYNGQVYQCVTTNTGQTPSPILPDSGTIYWEVASSYPPWQSGIAYQQGQTVSYEGGIYVATQNNPGGPPGEGDWETLANYYGTPTFYPGTETQPIDPLIQSYETAAYTPAFRGICYLVWSKFPLLNFGNRIPNLRAEVTFQKVLNVL